ncbi:MAG TPA: hypothetical protein VGO98_00190 [Candidatus Saccharimonadales bacterium]|jgi:hypothetical protein|nr:hypothetical protein [Candidatus Saccharimonadales bacterium]
MKDNSERDCQYTPQEDREERRCQARGRAALKAFNQGKTSFRVEPRFGIYYQFDPKTLDGHLHDIQSRLGAVGYRTVLKQIMIESGSEQKMPAYDLNLSVDTTDTETR